MNIELGFQKGLFVGEANKMIYLLQFKVATMEINNCFLSEL